MVTIYNTALSATSQRYFSDGLGGGQELCTDALGRGREWGEEVELTFYEVINNDKAVRLYSIVLKPSLNLLTTSVKRFFITPFAKSTANHFTSSFLSNSK